MKKKMIILVVALLTLSGIVTAGFLRYRAVYPEEKKICYVASDSALYIFDVSNPSKPVLLSSISVPAKDVLVRNDTAYIATGSTLTIFDVSDSSSPKQLGYVWTRGANGVDVVGNIAYVAGELGLYSVDVTDPSNLRLLDTSYLDNVEQQQQIVVRGEKVDVVDNVAYLACFHGLYFLDVSKPDNLKVLYSKSMSSLNRDIQVVGNLVYTVTGIAYFSIVNVSNPSSPNYLFSKSLRDGASNIWGVFVVDNIAYLADGGLSQLLILDVSNPSNPTTLGSYRGELHNPVKVQVVNKIAYVVDSSATGLYIIDVTNPTAPSLLSYHYTLHTAREIFVTSG
jgi:hypothetical protein